ncbi:unnamed protein product [Linum trigynum]|uniref:Auxin-responsive protein n=1 Tax=Linum trigynum TaxID=586398 RepID=A0AAV2CS49_9ROSI
MELQLGLALPTAGTNNNDNNLVFGNSNNGNHEVIVQSWLPAADNGGGAGTECSDKSAGKRRRVSDGDDRLPLPLPPVDLKTLPLLQWDAGEENDDNCSVVLNKIEAEEEGDSDGGDGIVGWPPINFRRNKKQRNQMMVVNRSSSCSGECGAAGPTPSMYVKVTMDGVGIGRKVDLALHDSFPSLRRQLFAMFGLPEENPWDGGAGEYQLTYQDPEGDWLLADDISWRSFIGSVQRLRLMRSSSSGSS